jgi:hypothetical protein
MKKTILLFLFIAFMKHSFGQDPVLPRIVNDTLYTSCGYNITVDQEVKLGTGTRDNGDFKFITVSKTSWLVVANPKQPSMHKEFGHHTAIVKKLKTTGNEHNGYIYYLILGIGDIVNYQCDVENAIAAGEIVVPDRFKAKTANGPTSVADELAKLKKLYDDSVITKEEFEAQKKKLLGEQ